MTYDAYGTAPARRCQTCRCDARWGGIALCIKCKEGRCAACGGK